MKVSRIILMASTISACAFLVACGGSSSPKTTSNNNVIATSGQNVAPIVVNPGPNGNYANGAFVSVTLCVPGGANCQTIGGLLVDTGSSGLRILSSALTVPLPQQKSAIGNPVVECFPFLGSYTWGPVQTADVQIAGEKASAVPIQVLSDTDFQVPSACPNGFPSADTLPTLGANGILGVGLRAQDCGAACVGVSNPVLYYECSSQNDCVTTHESLSAQVQNPVAMFPSDNNGVIVELPAASGAQATMNGSLIFGIGTQSNNSLGSAATFAVDSNASFAPTFKGQTYPGSFIDSGSNGYFFLTSALTGLPDCINAQGFYCPSSTTNLTASNPEESGSASTVNFGIGNAETLFSNGGDAVFGDLGGPAPKFFDWGLPFFYGRNVYTAIEGKSTPAGTGPFWAY